MELLMKRHLAFATIAVILLTIPLSAQRWGPRALAVEQAFDFGYVPQNSSIAHTYWLANLGTETLRVFDVKPGCGCTKSTLRNFTAEPNDSLPIELIFSSGRRTRQQNKGTRVLCNDPTKKELDLRILAWVYKEGEDTGPLKLGSSQLKLTTADKGKTFPIEIENNSDQALTLKIISEPADLFTVALPAGSVAAGESADIKIKMTDILDKRLYAKSVTFEVSDSSKTRYTIPIQVKRSKGND